MRGDNVKASTAWLAGVSCICMCLLGGVASAVADQGQVRQVPVVLMDAQRAVLSDAVVMYLDSAGQEAKAVSTGDGNWYLEVPYTQRKTEIWVERAGVVSLPVDVDLPGDPSAVMTLYLEEKVLRVQIGSPAASLATPLQGPPEAAFTRFAAGGARQGGDTCGTATAIGSLPFSDTGTTVGYTNDYDEVCPYSGSTSPDVAYSYSPASDITVDITLCNGSAYDTKLYVYEGSCPGALVACNDDTCPGYVSELTDVSLTGGNTYYIIVDGYAGASGSYVIDVTETTPPPPPPDCPAGSLFSQPTMLPTDSWSAGTSEVNVNGTNYLRFESFSGLTGPVCDLHWWGLDLVLIGSWTDCTESDPTFEIKFYQDAGGVPGAEVCSNTATATVTPTGLLYAGFELNYYSIDALSPCCALADGWVSIQGFGDTGCWFLWMSSGTGDGSSCLMTDGVQDCLTYLYDNSLCLTGVPATGACCDESTGICTDNVNMADCDGRFEADTLCADLVPPCTIVEPTGACCNPDPPYNCQPDKTEADCDLAYGPGNWQGAGTTCDPNPCVPGCDHTIVLTDDYGDGWNGGQVEVFVDGGSVGVFTLVSGSGPETHVFNAATGSAITTVYTPGSWSYENEYHIYDVNGTEICADGVGGTTPTGCSATGYCGPDPCLGNEPPNDECVTATPVSGPYPTTVSGTNECAGLDCPGVLDWHSTWWAIDLPYASSNLHISFCGNGFEINNVGIVYYNDCSDCSAYIVYDSIDWYSCSDGITAPQIDWLNISGPGTVYFPVYFNEDTLGPYTFEVNVTENIVPTNDLCEDAIPIAVPSQTSGSTIGTSTDTGFPYCGTSITSPGVWYSLIGTGHTLTADTCTGTSFDSKISVYCKGCDDTICVDGNDDTCGLQSSVTWCSQSGAEYLILVHGYGGATGPFVLTVTDDGVPCTADVLCLPLGACCLPDASCDILTEGDCNSQGGAYQGDDTDCGGLLVGGEERFVCNDHATGALTGSSPTWDRVYGSDIDVNCNASLYDSYSNGQYYEAIPIATSVSENLEAEVLSAGTTIGDTVMTLYCDPFDPANPLDNAIAYDDDGGTGLLSAFWDSDNIFLQAGTQYWLVLSTFSAGNTGSYDICLGGHFAVGGAAPGACCMPDGSCVDNMEASACTDAGGTFGGGGSDCATVVCPALIGACCPGDGSCVITTDTCCASAGGLFLGGGTDCGEATLVVLSEDFEGGIPGSWTVTDDMGSGLVWHTNDYWGDGNYTGCTGLAAEASSDEFGSAPYDTSLITPVLDLSGTSNATLDCMVNFQNFAGYDYFYIDVSYDAGGSWNNLLTWNEDHGTFHGAPGEQVTLGLGSVTATTQVRFRFYDPVSHWNWEVSVDCITISVDVEADNPCPQVQPAALDIKPGSCPNSFNRSSHGVLPVALMSTAQVDVALVDLSTVTIRRADGVGGAVAPHEGPPGPHSTYEDAATPFDGEPCACHDAGADGVVDLSMKFKVDDVVAALQLNDLNPGDLVELEVTGFLTDGTEFVASDCVRLVPPATPPGRVPVISDPAEAWIGIGPLDLQLDGGGFAAFERSYPLGSMVTFSAELTYYEKRFVGWWLNGVFQGSAQTIAMSIVENPSMVDAIFRRPGDIDGNEVIDLNDFAVFAFCYQGPNVTTPPPGASAELFAFADFDRDGDVDLNDFAIFAQNFGT